MDNPTLVDKQLLPMVVPILGQLCKVNFKTFQLLFFIYTNT